jgi:hypothetical protein
MANGTIPSHRGDRTDDAIIQAQALSSRALMAGIGLVAISTIRRFYTPTLRGPEEAPCESVLPRL